MPVNPIPDVPWRQRLFVWQRADNRNHAIRKADYPLPPRPGEDVDVLCGRTITLAVEDFPALTEVPGGSHPTCWECEAEWRKAEGIPIDRNHPTRRNT
ncbi:zinc finger protein [Herbihabitans rhizosphaerae]|uniref:Zinc finger protein n=1 Tax=Herbihabitans rhizosphaerae TaxID=1872711 RepID=A0A4Q7KG59_9PSEU|nr:zinc finger protein [Herbihabitans rhizosphaerae]RZS34059.1 zinc finger protein [Herbihabitans rhizosphaerae]